MTESCRWHSSASIKFTLAPRGDLFPLVGPPVAHVKIHSKKIITVHIDSLRRIGDHLYASAFDARRLRDAKAYFKSERQYHRRAYQCHEGSLRTQRFDDRRIF